MVLQILLIGVVSFAVLVGLPLVVTLRLLSNEEEEEDAPAWWHKQAGAMDSEGDGSSQAGAAAGGKLVGGSRQVLQLDKCARCGAGGPAFRCTGCRSVAFCSKDCQKAHWVAGHKRDCSKLRKQQQQEARLEAAAAAAPVAPAGDSTTCAAGSKAGGSRDKPEESNSVPPVPQQVLYPSERYAELAAAPPQRKHPLGLQNVGNSCYANSLLQSLMATPSLAAYLVSGEHSRGCLKPSPSDWCVLCELEKLAVQAHAGGAKVLNPRPLLRNVKRLGKQFSFGRQECSHELFLRMMEAIEAVQLLEAGGKAKFDLRSRETTFIHHVFAGYTRNQVECLSCGHVSRTYECCTSLPLEVGARVASLEAALKRFTATERLDGDNRYKCDGCKQYVSADKSTQLEAAPHCLQVCLKRFALGRYGKITSKLSFPEQLDLEPYMAEGCVDRDPKLYSLYAVVVHIDWNRSTDYGHYIAYVKCGGSWFLCDDSSVTPVAAAKALAAGAYLLFYERQAPRKIEAKPAAVSKTAEPGGAATAPPAAAPAVAAAAAEQKQLAKGAQPAAAAEGLAAAAAARRLEQQDQQPQHMGQQEEQQEAMPRVETAPASLPHMCSPRAAAPGSSPLGAAAPARTGSAALSAASSQEQLLAAAEDEEGIAVGLPDGRLHASASESDIIASRHCSAAVVVQHAQQEQQEQQEQQQRGHRAAKEPPLLPPQQLGADPQAEQCGADSDSGGSDASSASNFQPSLNPYNLLGSASGSEGSDSEEGSTASSSGGSDEPMGAQEIQGTALLPDGAGGSCEAVLQEQQPAPQMGSCEEQGSAFAPNGPAAAEAAPASPSAAEAAPTAEAPPCTPVHEAAIEKLPGTGKRVLRVTVALPSVEGEAAVDWWMQAGRGGAASRQTLVLSARQYELALPLPVRVAGEAGEAAWAPGDERLTLTWPVL